MKRRADALDFFDVPVLDFGSGILGFIGGLVVAIVVTVAFVLLIGPIALIGIDLVWVLAALVIGAFARFVLRHPWRVEATNDAGERFGWAFQGYRVAGRGRDLVADQLRAGFDPETISPPTVVPTRRSR